MRSLTVIGVALACGLVRAQEPTRDVLLQRLAAYSAQFVRDFSNVTSVELYEQPSPGSGRLPTRIRSDFLLVRAPGAETEFLQFRDVKEVNGRVIGDAQRRMERLFLEPFADARTRAEEIVRASGQYIQPVYMPLIALACVQAREQSHYRFTGGAVEGRSRPRVRSVEFVEMPRGSIGSALGNIEVSGKVWFEEATGRITRTELRLGSLPWRREIATTFGRDRKLGIDVPVQMRIGNANGQMTGIMRYRDFRRFEVRTEESLKGVPAK